MEDVLCDFCRRSWGDDVPMVEGHQGSCICGTCLATAWRCVVLTGDGGERSYRCTMCLEEDEDRAALDRGEERGWRSPAYPDAAVCRRCIKQAAGALHKSPAYAWRKPEADGEAGAV